MKDWGAGPPLRDVNPWIRDPASRYAIILDVVERNSVIEGLPPFSDVFRRQLLEMLPTVAPHEPG